MFDASIYLCHTKIKYIVYNVKIIAFFMIIQFALFYVRVGILLTHGKHFSSLIGINGNFNFKHVDGFLLYIKMFLVTL